MSDREMLHRLTRNRENYQAPRKDTRHSCPSDSSPTDQHRARWSDATYQRSHFEDEYGCQEAPFDLDDSIASLSSLFIALE